jgi:uncharacterized protein YecT (DUF1311 family)
MGLFGPQHATGQTQSEMTGQSEALYKKARQDLAVTYKQLMAKVSPKGQTSLRKTEETWILYQDLECDFETLGSEDGSVHSMAVLDCRTHLTKVRTAELKQQLNCQEGDVACGNQ